MSILSKKKSGGDCPVGCVITKWVVCVLLFVAVVASAIGVYQAHVINGTAGLSFQFGATVGSLSILAFVASTGVFMKHMMMCLGDCPVCSK